MADERREQIKTWLPAIIVVVTALLTVGGGWARLNANSETAAEHSDQLITLTLSTAKLVDAVEYTQRDLSELKQETRDVYTRADAHADKLTHAKVHDAEQEAIRANGRRLDLLEQRIDRLESRVAN